MDCQSVQVQCAANTQPCVALLIVKSKIGFWVTFMDIASEALGASLQKLHSSPWVHAVLLFPPDVQNGRRRWDPEVKPKQNTLSTQRGIVGSAQFESLYWTEGAATVAEPRRASGVAHHPPLPATVTTGLSGHAQGQPHCTLCSNMAPPPHVKRAFHQLRPAHLKMERNLGSPGTQAAGCSWCSSP